MALFSLKGSKLTRFAVPRPPAWLGYLGVVFLASSASRQDQRKEIVQLNQGWSNAEIQFYNYATEGTNLAPLEFFLNLPDPAKPRTRFLEKLSKEYGFIPAEKSKLNPHALPVGFAIDNRPTAFGDRVYPSRRSPLTRM